MSPMKIRKNTRVIKDKTITRHILVVFLTRMLDFRIGDLDDGDGQVARQKPEKNCQNHLGYSPLAPALLDLTGVSSRNVGRLYRGWGRVLPHSRLRSNEISIR